MTGTGFALVTFDKGIVIEVKTFFVDNSKFAKYGNGVRLMNIYDALHTLLKSRNNENLWVAIEQGFTKFNVATQSLYRVVGVVELRLAESSIRPPTYIAPTSVKKVITGTGKGSKETVQEALMKYLPEPMVFNTLDESDAVAVALTYAIGKRFLKSVTTD
jgi:crossover junction endodeoxyribonuclease RuvC